MVRKGRIIAIAAVALTLSLNTVDPSHASTTQVKKAGSLTASDDAALMIFCPDPLIQQTLNQDFRAVKRNATADSTKVQSLTVTVSQQPLKPGVSMEQVAPGNPQVAELIKQAGGVPPPLGDTGTKADQAAVAREIAQRQQRPPDSPLNRILSGEFGSQPLPCGQGQGQSPISCADPTPEPKPSSAGQTGDLSDYLNRIHDAAGSRHEDDSTFDIVVVARASLSGSSDELTVVALVPSGDDVQDAKKLVAEEIANAVLH